MDPYTALQPTTPVSSKCVIVTKCIGQRDAKVITELDLELVNVNFFLSSISISFFLTFCPIYLVLTVVQAGVLDNSWRNTCMTSLRLFLHHRDHCLNL